MSSLENRFDMKQDKWFDFDEDKNGRVDFTERKFLKMGNADAWLTSEAFDLPTSLSLDAEAAIKEYNSNAINLSYDKKKELTKKLEAVLSDSDPFWIIVDFKNSNGTKK